MSVFGRPAAFRCSRGAHCLLRNSVAVNIEAGPVLKVFVPDIIIPVTFNVVERGTREVSQQVSRLLNKFPLQGR